jgi:hypothetical protein
MVIYKRENKPPPTLERHWVLPLRLPSEEEMAEVKCNCKKS